MELGDVFDRGFRVWRENIKVGLLFLAASIIPLIFAAIPVIALISAIGLSALTGFSSLVTYLPEFMAGLLVALALYILIYAFFKLAALKACSLAIDGRMDFGEAINFAKRKFLTFIAAEILEGIIIAAPLVIPVVLIAASYATKNVGVAAAALATMIVFSIFSIVLAILLIYTPYAVAEGFGAVESLKVSYRVARRNFLETIVIAVVAFLINFACNLAGEIAAYMTLYPAYLVQSPSTQMVSVYSIIPLLGVITAFTLLVSSFVAMPLTAIFYLTFLKDRLAELQP